MKNLGGAVDLDTDRLTIKGMGIFQLRYTKKGHFVLPLHYTPDMNNFKITKHVLHMEEEIFPTDGVGGGSAGAGPLAPRIAAAPAGRTIVAATGYTTG